jgi:hypothetical protein
MNPTLLREEIRDHVAKADAEKAEAARLRQAAASLPFYRCGSGGHLHATRIRLECDAELADLRAARHTLTAADLYQRLR